MKQTEVPIVTIIKRAVDLCASVAGLLLLCPVIFLVGLLVLLDVGWPPLFVQVRPGLHGIPFRLVKFRTMRDGVACDGAILPDEQRLTRLGSFLRKWSLDELPELWNVLIGDMSLVGPRPLLMEYLPLYNERQFRRHNMKPGLTGLAQVSGRNSLSWEDKFDLDVYYVDHWSLWLDIVILVRTARQVLSASDISAPGHATMPPFRGSTHRSQGL
jgi:lipopolysaccharide/colanic/teichoic acid biosynthesis glycosyltransferase